MDLCFDKISPPVDHVEVEGISGKVLNLSSHNFLSMTGHQRIQVLTFSEISLTNSG